MKPRLILILIVLVIIVSFNNVDYKMALINGTWSIDEEVKSNNYDIYLVEEPDFDYSDENVYALAQEIKSESNSPKDALKRTIKYVVNNVHYSSSISTGYCYSEKASTVLDSKKGDCVSMSRLVTALLRAQGIPSRTVGGCLSMFTRCTPTFAVIPFMQTKVVPMVIGDFKKRGYLHEWVEVWLPEDGWMIVESTSGQVYPIECNTYTQYGYDSNVFNRCVISDGNFWELCAKK